MSQQRPEMEMEKNIEKGNVFDKIIHHLHAPPKRLKTLKVSLA